MKLIKQIGIVFGICWLSQCIEHILPISFPASVIGLILLLVLLAVKALRVKEIQDLSDFLLGNLPFLFIPAAAGIMNYANVIWANLFPFLTICVVSMIVTFGVTVWAVKLTMKLVNKEEEA